MSLKIEGANSEVSSKIKSAESKLLAKGKAKMPRAKEFKVKMRPNLVKASKGSFYGGHLYGTEDGVKWIKCAEVRIREGKEGAAPTPAVAKPTPAVAKPTEKVSEEHRIREALLHEIHRILSDKSWDFKKLLLIKLNELSSEGLQAEFSLSAENESRSGGFRRGPVWEEWSSTKRSIELTIEAALRNSFKLPGFAFSHARFYFQRNAPQGKRFNFSFALKLSRK